MNMVTTNDLLTRLGAKFCHFCKTTSRQLGHLEIDKQEKHPRAVCYECAQGFRDEWEPLMKVWKPI